MSKRLAIIIGNSLYRDDKLAKLTAPEADVGAFADALLDAEMGGFDDVKLLVNMASHTVRREISEFFSKKSRDDMLLFYFSGHGVLDDRGRLYLALKDTDTSLLRGTAIPANYITDEMDNSRSQRQVLILDCCHSGAFARGSKSATGASVGTASTFEGAGFGRVVLTASDATQYAWEGNQVIGNAENSLFTHFLVQGIKTGEADANKDGKITIDEIYDYAYTRILQETPKQTPGKWSFKEQGELIISHSPMVETQVKEEEKPETPEETQEIKLEKFYTDGLASLLGENWDDAIDKYEAILEIDPDYLDVKAKLQKAKIQKKVEIYYEQATAKYGEGNIEDSIQLLEEVVSNAPDYKDAAKKLEQYKNEKKLAELQAEARKKFDASDFEAVVKVYEEIFALVPDYADQDGLFEKAKAETSASEQKQILEDQYHRAMVAIESGKLEDARKILLKIQEAEKGYRDTDEQLAHVEAKLATKEEAPPTLPHVHPEYESKPKKGPTLGERLAAMPKWLWGVGAAAVIGGGILVVVLAIIIPNITNGGGDNNGTGNEPVVVDPGDNAGFPTPEEEVIEEPQVEEEPPVVLEELPGNNVKNPVDGAIAVLVPAGKFDMGADPEFGLKYCLETIGEGVCKLEDFQDESPIHTVYLDDFYIYETEVTVTQYAAFLNANGNQREGGASWYDEKGEFQDIYRQGATYRVDADFPDHPVVQVTWYGANAYCEWAGGRLPTEAEWEKAAKGETNNVFPWGDEFYSSYANVDDETYWDEDKIECTSDGCDTFDDTAPVGFFPEGVSPYGVFDMSGNVWEWVADWYDEDYYSNSPGENPQGPSTGFMKIRRGGSWWSYDLNVRIANRAPTDPLDADNTLGFRCALDPES